MVCVSAVISTLVLLHIIMVFMYVYVMLVLFGSFFLYSGSKAFAAMLRPAPRNTKARLKVLGQLLAARHGFQLLLNTNISVSSLDIQSLVNEVCNISIRKLSLSYLSDGVSEKLLSL